MWQSHWVEIRFEKKLGVFLESVSAHFSILAKHHIVCLLPFIHPASYNHMKFYNLKYVVVDQRCLVHKKPVLLKVFISAKLEHT